MGGALLAGGLEPAACKRMMRELAQPAEKYPDAVQPGLYGIRTTTGNGTHENWPYTSQMFAKLRTAKYLKAVASSDSASVEFEGRVQRIARVHHYGLRDCISRKGPEVSYAERHLLGFNDDILERLKFFSFEYDFIFHKHTMSM